MGGNDAASARETQVRAQVAEALVEAGVVIKIRKKDLMKWPADVEALHQHRISLRVARSLVKFLKPYLKGSRRRELQAALKQLQDPTSRVRELDVLVPQVSNPQLRALCQQAQAQARASFIAGLKAPETQEALAFVENELRHPAWNRNARANGIPQAALAQRVEAQRNACENLLDSVDFSNTEAVHDLRKQAKALRYVSRELKPCLPEGSAQVGSRMREMQDKLGAWCDARVNAALVAQICGDAGQELAMQFESRAQAIMQEMRSSRQQAGKG